MQNYSGKISSHFKLNKHKFKYFIDSTDFNGSVLRQQQESLIDNLLRCVSNVSEKLLRSLEK